MSAPSPKRPAFDLPGMRGLAFVLSPFAAQAILECADEIERLHAHAAAAVAAERERSRWSPIETAPDVREFSAIVACPLAAGGYYVEEAWWDYERREWWPANVDHTDTHGSQVYPTHWMNLPAPPTGSAA